MESPPFPIDLLGEGGGEQTIINAGTTAGALDISLCIYALGDNTPEAGRWMTGKVLCRPIWYTLPLTGADQLKATSKDASSSRIRFRRAWQRPLWG
jgi:hypothetical protein